MKVLLVNTSDKTGGAAIAASRLMSTLRNSGVDATMLVADHQDVHNSHVAVLPNLLRHKFNFLFERLAVFARQRFSKRHLFDIDPALTGTDITRLPEFREADLIHLHWVNQGFLSLGDIRRILESGKPVVWTMHDMWTFAGICHYVRDCGNYKAGCGDCPLLVCRGPEDLSHKIWQKKKLLWDRFPNLTFVACSKWLAETAAGSPLLKDHRVVDIVNPIDCRLYAPRDKGSARQALALPLDGRRLILFCAYNVTLPIKGLAYLREALALMAGRHGDLRERLGVVMVGKGSETAGGDFPVDVFPMGFVTDESLKAQIYNAADIFVIPSLQDNLPNTIVEAKASGLPVIGTRVGGIPQMISHMEDGCLVEPENADELAKSIEWMLFEADLGAMSAMSRANAESRYSETAVARRYIECYEALLHKHTNDKEEK